VNGRARILRLDTGPSEPRVFTVSELAQAVKSTLEEGFGLVVVQGEISNYKRHSSGHHYFQLKDEKAQIEVALFKGPASRLGVALQSGMAVQVEGELTSYPPRSQYQIVATRVTPIGYGALQAQFEALKRRLQTEGLFAEERKRPLPRYPTRIGLVTSPTGAAVQDMLRVLRARAPYAAITLAPVKVQGEGAAEEIAAAVALLNEWGQVDVIIAARGGGSPQDLWAFNEEVVVRALATSRIPTVSAVGHEVDFTLADFAADVRAATPTHAARASRASPTTRAAPWSPSWPPPARRSAAWPTTTRCAPRPDMSGTHSSRSTGTRRGSAGRSRAGSFRGAAGWRSSTSASGASRLSVPWIARGTA
jgi:exodeoxyribonuclease VII large subunit